MILYTIYYEYLDKREYRRSKKLLCCGEDRLREKCLEIEKLTERKPVATPTIYVTEGTDNYIKTISYDKALKGEL